MANKRQEALDRTFDYLTNAAMLVTMAETKREHLKQILCQLHDANRLPRTYDEVKERLETVDNWCIANRDKGIEQGGRLSELEWILDE